jgi:hypothetical protein
MAVSKATRSSLKTKTKYVNSSAGNQPFPWASTVTQTIYGGYGTLFTVPWPDALAFFETEDGRVFGVAGTNGPGALYGTKNYGQSWSYNYPNIGYSTYVSGFNGSIFGGGNYMTSAAGYYNDIGNGATYLTGYSSISASFGRGAGGWTSANVPVWMIEGTLSGVHKIISYAGAPGSRGIQSPNWTTTTVATATGNGYQARVALTNDIVVYAYNTNTTPAAANVVIAYAAVTPSTGAFGSFSNGTISGLTGPIASLVTVNGTFVLSTTTNQLYTSTNGSSWTARTSPLSGSASLFITKEWGGLVLAGTTSGTSGTNSIYKSSDGINWTLFAAVNSGGAATLSGFATGPGVSMSQVNGSQNVFSYNTNAKGLS